MTVDKKVYALAESFIDDLEQGLTTADMMVVIEPVLKLRLTQRAAEAMQLAIEQECEAIRKELEA